MSQYLQYWPLFFITSAIHSGSCWILASGPNPDWWRSILALIVLGVDDNLWASACLLAFWGLTTGSLWNWGPGSCLATDPKFQCNGLRATSLVLLLCDMMLENARIITKLLLDRWKKSLLQDILVSFFIHGSVFGQNYERAHSLGWKATPHMDGLRMLHCWHNTGLMVAFTFEQSIFQMSQTVWKELHQRK